MFRRRDLLPARRALLALLAVAPLVSCVSQPASAPGSKAPSVPVSQAPSAKQQRQAKSATYERGFLAGRRYQAALDASRPPPPCATPGQPAPPPAPAPVSLPATAPASAPASSPASSLASAAPRPSPLPAGSYAPSGPAQPVALPGS
ncbi:MAG TPA: hypothetical protein VLT37_00740 [Acidocella sp.]|nr:hypothetical protein [Acidocella sp.]